MLFKVDENLPVDVCAVLRVAGHDAVHVVDQAMQGAGDADVGRVCRRERRTLVTLDLDFSDIRLYPPHEYPGLIVLRLPQTDRDSVLHCVSRVIPLFDREPIEGLLWIVEPGRIRVRGGA